MTAEEMAQQPSVAKSRRWQTAAILALAGCLVLTLWLAKHILTGTKEPPQENPSTPILDSIARASIPLDATVPMAPIQAPPNSLADVPELVGPRKPVAQATAIAKPIPANLAGSAVVKANKGTVLTSVAKPLSAASVFKLFMKQSRLVSYQSAENRNLFEIKEINLDEPDKVGNKSKIAQRIKNILKLTKDDPDAFVKKIKDRRDLSGLPFIMGEQCRLPARAASSLQRNSRLVRSTLDRSRQPIPVSSYSYSTSELPKDSGVRFWEQMNFDFGLEMDNLPALEQILLAESTSHRMLFMKKLKATKEKAAPRILAQRAIFDPDYGVRETALEALKDYPPQDVEAILVQGLRYPWPQVVNNSAVALLKLNRADLVPELVNMLDQPDPEAPFLGGPKKNQLMVRELVRVNHHRNCLLCHAPVDRQTLNRSVPLVPIPTPGERMPTSSVIYYSARGENVVRADVTYLRQDFSVMLQVPYSHPWPAEQRYDFFVRVRPFNDKEAQDFKSRTQPSQTAHKTTILLALKALTGEDAGYSAAAWRQLLDPRRDRAWRSSCNK
jgi:hypothetical protein